MVTDTFAAFFYHLCVIVFRWVPANLCNVVLGYRIIITCASLHVRKDYTHLILIRRGVIVTISIFWAEVISTIGICKMLAIANGIASPKGRLNSPLWRKFSASVYTSNSESWKNCWYSSTNGPCHSSTILWRSTAAIEAMLWFGDMPKLRRRSWVDRPFSPDINFKSWNETAWKKQFPSPGTGPTL